MEKPIQIDLDQPTTPLEKHLLLRRASGDPELFRELIEMLRVSGPQDLQKIKTAVEAQDAAGLERNAHSVKGMMQNFFRGRVVALAYTLELMGREKQLDGAQRTLSALEEEFRLSQQMLEEIGKTLEAAR